MYAPPTLRERFGSASPRRARGAAVALAAALVGAASSVRAQTPAPVEVAVDATVAGAPLERVWPFHGYDEINYTTDPEGRALLATIAAAHTAPVHVRSHFLFNTGDGVAAMKWGSTNVYTEDAAGSPIYSWTLTDGILDTLTQAGAFPFVELGFMPQALSIHPTPYRNSGPTTLDGGCFYPPSDYGKWGNLVRAWATHAKGRYSGVTERWLWELWNEPDIAYWQGTFDEYAKLYDHTESALHDVLPGAALGGPAVASAETSFLPQFLQHCASGVNAVTGQIGTRLDLVSFHAKGGVILKGSHFEMDLGNQLRLHQAGFRAVAAEARFKQTPIYITEADPDGCAACPASLIPGNAYRNSPAYGAYELALMKHTLELEAQVGVKLGGVLTWAFTFPGTPWFAAYRTLATNGISLPILGAFQLLGRLAGNRVPLTSSGSRAIDDIIANGVRAEADVDGIASTTGDAVQVLVWNYHDDGVAVAPTPVRLRAQVPASFGSRVRVSHLRVDESHGDAYTVWVAQGMPADPSADQVAALRAAMAPTPVGPEQLLEVGADGAIALAFDLPRFGVSLVTLLSPDAAADGGQGGSSGGAGGIPGPPRSSGGCGCRAWPSGENDPSGGAALLSLGAASVVYRGRQRKARRGF